ncbi:MAG: DUF2336 domain-containing protein [Pseudomonadota bacterium]
MAVVSNLHKLGALAEEKSSTRRRQLLRDVTNLFFASPPEAQTNAQAQFGQVLSKLASDAASDAREQLAERFADAPLAPRQLIEQLARDAIEIAAPILQRSNVLNEEDLVAIVHERGQEHMRAIAERAEVPERVADAIVERGDDNTVAALVDNEGARLSRGAFETVTQRAENSETLQAPLVQRADTPVDLLGDLMNVVGRSLRDTILERFDELEPGVVEAALAASQTRLEARISEDKDITAARKFITTRQVRKELDGALLARLLREGERVKFCVGFAEMTGVDYLSAKRALEHESVDGLALICKAADLEKALFITLAVLRSGAGADAFQDARELGRLYDVLSQDAAERAMRFQRMRQQASS